MQKRFVVMAGIAFVVLMFLAVIAGTVAFFFIATGVGLDQLGADQHISSRNQPHAAYGATAVCILVGHCSTKFYLVYDRRHSSTLDAAAQPVGGGLVAGRGR